jgi:hypothetical protein
MLVRAYLRASTAEQDVSRAKALAQNSKKSSIHYPVFSGVVTFIVHCC